MYTILGLGNPGDEYGRTRHNAGRIIVSALRSVGDFSEFKGDSKSRSQISSGELSGEKVKLVLPDTFMNKSGISASYYVKSEKAARSLIVVHDDLDLPLGTLRLSFGRGSGGHKGIESITRAIKTKDFIRLRVGISNDVRGKTIKPKGEKEVQDFVLGEFDKKSKEVWIDVEKRAISAITILIQKGLEAAMNEFNQSK